MTTSPDSIALAADIAYGLLGPYPANVVNVQDYGVDPTGNDDCRVQFQAAVDALPSIGGQIVIPPGDYLMSGGVSIPSNVSVVGAGRGVTKLIAQTDFPTVTGPEYSFFYNENWSAADLASGDSDISFEGITFDYSWRTTTNAFASLKLRYITRLAIRNCRFNYGGNAIAVRGCEQVWVEGNDAYEFRNCAWDFWEGPGTTILRGNYAETSDTAQMHNFNPEVSPVASSPLNVIARRLSVIGNVFKATGASPEPIQIEPLAARDTGVDNVVVSGNTFIRTYLVLRGNVTNATITGNTFEDYPDPNTNVIITYPNYTYTPNGIVISNNVIKEPNTSSSFGVIWCDADNAVVTGNVITGTSYTGIPFYSGTSTPTQFGNYFEKLGVTGRMHQGFVIDNPDDPAENFRSCIGWVDTDGDALRMYMEGDFHQFHSTNADGTLRQVWSMEANNSSAQFNILLGTIFSDQLRISPDVALTALGATSGTAKQLTKNFNEVTTTAAGTGVRLPVPGGTSVVGLRVTVWNAGANTLNVYPMPGGQIDALGADVPDTIATGVCKVYVGLTATLYRIET